MALLLPRALPLALLVMGRLTPLPTCCTSRPPLPTLVPLPSLLTAAAASLAWPLLALVPALPLLLAFPVRLRPLAVAIITALPLLFVPFVRFRQLAVQVVVDCDVAGVPNLLEPPAAA